MMDNQLTSEEGLAKALSITTRHVQKLRRDGQIPFIRVNHRTHLYSLEKVVAALERLEIKTK
jgi:hypothetical protein